MTLPRISIVTPSFNQGKFLEETIQSVLSQNYPDLEYFVIDGGSTDNSIDIIKKYEGRLNYWVSEKDCGQSEAINKGLKRASGEIVAWLNSDDTYLDETLNRVAALFRQNPSVDLLYGNVENIYPDGRKKLITSDPFKPIRFLRQVNVHQPSVFWKRKLHSTIGWLDESLYYMMDYDLWMRIFFSHECLRINETFSRFRIHDNSKTTGNPIGLYSEYRKVLSRFFYSLNRQDLIQKLETLTVYDNKAKIDYSVNIHFNPTEIMQMMELYIQQCAIQEYSYCHVKNANKLFIASMNAHNFLLTLEFLIKNNSGIRFLTSRFR